MIRWTLHLCIVLGAFLLAGCSTTPLLSTVAISAPTLSPSGAG